MHTSRLWQSFAAAYGGRADRHVVFSTACYPTRIRISSLGAPKTRNALALPVVVPLQVFEGTDTATLVIGILYHKPATADSCGELEALNKLLHSPVWKTDCRK